MQQQIISQITEEPLLLAVIKRKLVKWLPLKRKHKLEIGGITLNTVYQLTALLLQAKTESELENDLARVYDIIGSNYELAPRFLAIAINNKPSPPPEWLIKCLKEDFSHSQISAMVKATYGRLGIEDFFSTMALMLKVSLMPKNTRGATAHTQ